VVDPDDPVFLSPGDMPARIAQAAERTGQRPPAGPPATVRCILDSLALAYRRAIGQVQELSGQAVRTVHVVGGGVRNELLLQLTADACGLPVTAGPAEAAALGNILIQARALGSGPGDLDAMRALLRATQPLRRYDPSGSPAAWDAAARRISSKDHLSRTSRGAPATPAASQPHQPRALLQHLVAALAGRGRVVDVAAAAGHDVDEGVAVGHVDAGGVSIG
jgi:FGGY family of carbohydrate kinases, C-terminal domain